MSFRSLRARTIACCQDLALVFFLTLAMCLGLAFDGVAAETHVTENSWHWQVQRVSGRVVVETKLGETLIAKRGMNVRKGWKIKTGNGRIAFVRGKEKFVISPNSIVTLEPKGLLVKRTVIYQDRGEVEVDVSRKWYRHFRVETPFLAAVVKGTSFKVRVNRNSASVRVGRGTVNVHDFASGDSADVSAGQSASTNPTRRVGLSVAGKTRPEIQAGPKRAPAFNTRIVKNVPASQAMAKAANGQGNGLANSNAGKSNNGKSANAGSNGNSSNASNSSSGGNGNGNSGGNGNGKSGGNGNGNSGGNGNGNSGGNGNGNSGGNGNGNSGGNGNGNSGGNGNGNSGGNGNGRN